jgi:hypothetical protein
MDSTDIGLFRSVQFFFYGSPVRQEMIHIILKYFIMASFQEMDQFMDYDILQAFRRFFGELQVKTDFFRSYIAGSPAGFHIPD